VSVSYRARYVYLKGLDLCPSRNARSLISPLPAILDGPRGKEEAGWFGSDLVSVPFSLSLDLRTLCGTYFSEAATDNSIVIRSIIILESLLAVLCCCIGRAGSTSECVATANLDLLAVVRLLRPKKTRTRHVTYLRFWIFSWNLDRNVDLSSTCVSLLALMYFLSLSALPRMT